MTTKKRAEAKTDAAVPAEAFVSLEAGTGDSAKQETIETTTGGFPVVGIGASAGGLAAFESFFSGMPADAEPGMAFVLVQHLAPDHKSILTELIRRYTRMQVFEVVDGMTVAPNCAYIIPPNRDMAFMGGALHLLEPDSPRGQRMPIDYFFRSLAQDQRERAICIVLSGTGSDGTLGLRAIKGEGGMAMAQDPTTTEYDGMPRSAIATGLVDFELPPAEMPAQLMAYVSHALVKPPQPAARPLPRTESSMKKICILLRAQTGHDFSLYKPSTLHRRIERRMAVHQLDAMDGYVRFLQQTPAEVDALFRDLLIGVTSFFRDPEAFMALEEQIIAKLLAGKPAGSTIRVWSPGCSSGEEAYSMAILLAEQQDALKRSFTAQVFATDIDSQAINTARIGIYPASIAADVSRERLERFFTVEPGGGAYRIHKSIRDMLVFSEQDVIKDPPFSKLDLIICRNLLIYMGTELQKKLIPLFHYALNPGGFLFLGTSETVGDFTDLFATLDRKAKLYRRKEAATEIHRLPLGKFLPPMTDDDAVLQQTKGKTPVPARPTLRDLTERSLLQETVPAAALVRANGDILYLHGRTGLFLEPSPGEASLNIIRMAREGLKRDLTSALHSAATGGQQVRRPGLRVKTNGDYTLLNLAIHPVAHSLTGSTQEPLYLVVLELAPSAPPSALQADGLTKAGDVAGAATDADTRIAALQQELRAKEEYLQTANEELETSNEELKSANEEMQSVNEELQSTNEELETSKEELQSVNEELATVNAELQTKVSDLSRANNDMNNLLAGTGIATIFVDHQLRILRFTPSATQVINLIQSDIGRPVGHIVSNLKDYDALVADARTVLDTLMPKSLEVQTATGTWYTMRIQPYRTLENVIEGVVVTFVDITERKRSEKAIHAERVLLQSVMNGAGKAHLVYLDRDFNFVCVNETYAATCGYRPDEMVGKNHFVLYPHAENEAIFRRVRDSGQPFEIHDKPFEFPDQPERGTTYWDWTLTPVVNAENQVTGLVLSLFETTERTQAEEALRKNEEMLRTVLNNSRDGINLLDLRTGRYSFMNEAQVALTGFTAEEINGISATEAYERVHPDDRHISIEQQRQVATGEDIKEPVEYRWKVKSGEYRWFSDRRKIVLDKDGTPVALVGVSRDITERKLAEEMLRESEHLLREILANLPKAYISVIEPDLTIGFTTGQEFKKQRLDPEAFIGQPLETAFGEQAPLVREHYLRAFKGEEVEFELSINNQRQFYRVIPLLDTHGRIKRILAVVENITDHPAKN